MKIKNRIYKSDKALKINNLFYFCFVKKWLYLYYGYIKNK